MSTTAIRTDIQKLADPQRAKDLQRYFKTHKGSYGEGDKFIGLTVPQCRLIVKQYQDLQLSDIKQLLTSTIHEERLIALLIVRRQYEKTQDTKQKESLIHLYLAHTKWINNWDLVDLSTAMLGDWLKDKDRSLLYELAKSKLLWERRIAMVATYVFIANGESADTFKIATILLPDTHDLIHKAVGWMLREVGKRCGSDVLLAYLQKNYDRLPRTTLRYAIEKFDEPRRQRLLKGDFS